MSNAELCEEQWSSLGCIWWSAINGKRIAQGDWLCACVCICVCASECLAGSRGAWGSAMPPTVVYLELVHAPLGGVDPWGALPQHSSISGCANLATMLWHPRFSSGPGFSLFLLSQPSLTVYQIRQRWDGLSGPVVKDSFSVTKTYCILHTHIYCWICKAFFQACILCTDVEWRKNTDNILSSCKYNNLEFLMF